jgi:hypothetical protein
VNNRCSSAIARFNMVRPQSFRSGRPTHCDGQDERSEQRMHSPAASVLISFLLLLLRSQTTDARQHENLADSFTNLDPNRSQQHKNSRNEARWLVKYLRECRLPRQESWSFTIIHHLFHQPAPTRQGWICKNPPLSSDHPVPAIIPSQSNTPPTTTTCFVIQGSILSKLINPVGLLTHRCLSRSLSNFSGRAEVHRESTIW